MKITPRPFPRSYAEKVVSFLPYFQKNDTFMALANDDKPLLYGIYNKECSVQLNDFLNVCSSNFIAINFDNRGDWGLVDQRDKLLDNPDLIAYSDIITLRMLFGMLTDVRLEDKKYTMYILNADIIVIMLLRLEELIPEIPVVTHENEKWLDKIIAWADKKGIEDYNTTPETLNTIWGGLPRDKELLLNSYVLEIGWNKLGKLPKEIGNLTNLIEIRAWCASLSSIPKEIGNLVNLRELSLVDNNLKELPSEIGKLKNLVVLSLDNNPIKKLPKEIGDLTNLEILELTECRMSEISAEVGRLQKLKELKIERCKKITKLPNEIGQLHNLQSLVLWENSILELPRSIGNLINLIHLNLYGNKLNKIPEEIGNLTKLKFLRLNRNNLTELPKTMNKLINLHQWTRTKEPPYVKKKITLDMDDLTFSVSAPHITVRGF
jgi:hypothetical protein